MNRIAKHEVIPRPSLSRSLMAASLIFLLLVLCALAVPAQARITPRDIQKAQRQANQLHRGGKYAQAVKLRQQVYNWSRQLYGARHVQTASAAFDLGRAQMTMGNFGPVESLFLEALGIFQAQRIRNNPNVATIYNSLATYYSRMGQVAEADSAYRKCIQILKANRQTLALSSIYYNLATLYRHQGLALREFAQRVPVKKERQKIEADARKWFVSAQNLLKQDLANLSRRRLPAKDTRRHNRQSTLGEVNLDLGNFKEADRLFVSAKQFWDRYYGRDTHGRDLLNLGLSRMALGQYKQALDYFQRASALVLKSMGKDNPTYPTTLALQARALAHLGRYTKAAEVMDRCQRVERNYILRVFPSLSQTEQLSYLFRPGYLEGRNLDSALAIGVAGRTSPGMPERSAEWLINAKAMVHELLAERSLAARSRPGKLSSELQKTHSKLANLLSQLNSVPSGSAESKKVIKALSQWLRYEASLSKQLGRTRGAANRQPWIDLKTIRQRIPRNGVLVEFARYQAPVFGTKGGKAISGSPRYAAWIIPPIGRGRVEVVDLGNAIPIELSIKKLRDVMAKDVTKIRKDIFSQYNKQLLAYAKKNQLKSSDDAYKKELYRLSTAAQNKIKATLKARAPQLLKAYRQNAFSSAKLLLHPLAGKLQNAKQVLLSPDAHTWLPPWGALPLPGSNKLLIQQATLTYLVSGRDLLNTHNQAIKASAPVVVGDVNYNFGVRTKAEQVKHPAVRLAWSPVEIKGIKPQLTTYTKMKPLILRGNQATEEKLKAVKNPKVLFLSTHGLFSNVNENTFRPGQRGLLLENPLLRSELSLAGTNRKISSRHKGEDGRLYGIEVGVLDLRATDLVVLSACQTALGDVHAGQGAAGLRQAFQLAGAKSVVATLWSVDDEATTLLTIAFFNYLAGGSSKTEALRQAQLSLYHNREWAHPFFWAAFTITENGKL
jgi:CHAT domain-containing protein/Tfp pilus assembly protein PilF